MVDGWKNFNTPAFFALSFIPVESMNNIPSGISDSETMWPEYKVVACTIRKSKGKYKVKV